MFVRSNALAIRSMTEIFKLKLNKTSVFSAIWTMSMKTCARSHATRMVASITIDTQEHALCLRPFCKTLIKFKTNNLVNWVIH